MAPSLVGVLVGAAVSIVGFGVTVAVAIYQVTKQARSGLKVELYKDFLGAVDDQSNAEAELSTKLRVLNSLIGVWLAPEQFPGYRPNPNTNWAELNDLASKCQTQAANLMTLIEKWQIVEPKLDLFRLAFGVALREIRATWQAVSALAGATLPPVDRGPFPQITNEALEALKAANEALINAASRLSAWVVDFQLEVQAVLLSDLFSAKLTHREPIDPEFFVVRLDQYDSLKDFFENRTAWGLEMKAINEQTKQIVADRQLSAS